MFIGQFGRVQANETRAQSFQVFILGLTRAQGYSNKRPSGIASADRIGQALTGPLFRARLAVNWTFG
jgi:hypothetical protein